MCNEEVSISESVSVSLRGHLEVTLGPHALSALLLGGRHICVIEVDLVLPLAIRHTHTPDTTYTQQQSGSQADDGYIYECLRTSLRVCQSVILSIRGIGMVYAGTCVPHLHLRYGQTKVGGDFLCVLLREAVHNA